MLWLSWSDVYEKNTREQFNVRELDDRINQVARKAPPFYRSSSLFELYLLMIPGCLVPALTLRFDDAMMNGLQAVPAWDGCLLFYVV